MIKLTAICVRCGKKATEGSYKHPYCKNCFKLIWNNDKEKYDEYLTKKHDNR